MLQSSRSKKNGEMEGGIVISPRELTITWAEDCKYWEWINYLDDGRDDRRRSMIEVPRLIKVWYLKIKGRIEMSRLSPGASYEVVVLLTLEDLAEGWEHPVKLKIEHPAEKSSVSRKVGLDGVLNRPEKNRGWAELKVGEFTAKVRGEVVFSVSETKSNQHKTGLLIKGVAVRPVAAGQPNAALTIKFIQFLVRGLGFKFLEIFYEDISRFLLYLAAIFMKRD